MMFFKLKKPFVYVVCEKIFQCCVRFKDKYKFKIVCVVVEYIYLGQSIQFYNIQILVHVYYLLFGFKKKLKALL